MVFLKNPGGRVVAVSDDDREYLLTRGFIDATEAEIATHVLIQQEKLRQMEVAENKDGVYFATVTPGGADGYGSSSANLIREIRKNGVNVSTSYEGQDICILYHSPYSLLRVRSPYKILYTMFESTKLPDDWKPYLEAADEIWTPSKWCQKLFKDAGFDAKVVPLGYDQNIFTVKPREDKSEGKKEFVFLHYNAYDLRKGFLELFEAFRQEFDPSEPVRMIFKSSRKTRPDMASVAIPILPDQYPNITSIFDPWTPQQLRDLCYVADCFVFPSRGEGVWTDPIGSYGDRYPSNSTQRTRDRGILCVQYMYEAKVGQMVPAKYQRYKGMDVGEMYKCNVNELRKTMRWVYTHQEECRSKGVKASEYVKNWTIARTGAAISERIKEIQAEGIKPKPLSNILEVKTIWKDIKVEQTVSEPEYRYYCDACSNTAGLFKLGKVGKSITCKSCGKTFVAKLENFIQTQ